MRNEGRGPERWACRYCSVSRVRAQPRGLLPGTSNTAWGAACGVFPGVSEHVSVTKQSCGLGQVTSASVSSLVDEKDALQMLPGSPWAGSSSGPGLWLHRDRCPADGPRTEGGVGGATGATGLHGKTRGWTKVCSFIHRAHIRKTYYLLDTFL